VTGPKLLSEEDIKEALQCLSEELAAVGQSGYLVIVGGAAIALTLGKRRATKDIDGYIAEPEEAKVMRDAAVRAADRLGLPPDWLNDGAKCFMVGVDLGPVVFETRNLRVCSASPTQLLAMKLWAWRDDQDFEDAERLLREARKPEDLTLEDLWGRLAAFIQDAQHLKARYALEDLWEKVCADDPDH
jgi:hypothetical protein